jgi:Mn2+/Fe2+ NRAMP family transporter
MMACLADSDIGGLLTMAVSGSQCGYLLLPLQLLLAPVLYMAQELTVRLGACSHRSLSGLAFDHLGRAWGTLTLLACISVGCTAVVSEFTGVAAVGELWGIPRHTSCCLSAILLSVVVLKGDFRSVEKFGLCLGSFMCIFLVLGLFCHPSAAELVAAFSVRNEATIKHSQDLRKIVAANFGTVITPWMLFYQLSAVVEKRLVPADITLARADTAVGAVATQAVMAAVLMTFARLARGADLEHLPLREALVVPLEPLLGTFGAKVLMSCGLLASSMLATLVASLAVAWNCSDTLGSRGTSSIIWRLVVFLSIVCAALIIGCNLANIIRLNILIQVVNGFAMPFVVGVLFFLARGDAVTPALRLQGPYSVACATSFVACSVVVVLCTVI